MTEAPTQDAPSDPLVNRAVRLFSYLGRAQQLKNPSVTDVDTYRRDGAVHWLHDLPEHPALQVPLRGGTPTLAEPVLQVDRVVRLDPPHLVTLLRPWLDGATDDPRRPPELRAERFVDTPEPDEDPAAPPLQRVDAVVDHPDVEEAYEDYRRAWAVWAEQELRDEPVRALYGDLFSTFVTATGRPEELELVVGTGLLAWRPDGGGAVQRHLLTTAATLTFDADSGRLTVAVHEGADGPRVEVEMLDPSVLGTPVAVNDVRELARAVPVHPLDRDRAGELARRLVHLLAADAEYRDQDERVDVATRPVAAFAPAIILRRRSQQGLVEIFQAIVAEIERSGRVPDGIRPLVDADHEPAAGPATERSDGAVVRVDDEMFLPLPVNDKQMRILQQVDTHAQTLIQGPPGTGKTHTAAALISHLLAQGKRVLITAQTDRALKEVRDKLPDEIRPLAVSVVGAAREDMSDLRTAVERIGTTAAEFDAAEAGRTIDDHLAAINTLRRLRAELHHRLVEARESEVRSHEVAGYRGTRAELARQLDEDRPTYCWIKELVTPTTTDPPLRSEAAIRWLDLLRDDDLQADESDARKHLIELEALPTPERFAAMVESERRATAKGEHFAALRAHPAYAITARWPAQDRAELADRFRTLYAEMAELARRREPWLPDALNDMRNGRRRVWADRRVGIARLMEQAAAQLAAVGPATDIHIDGPTPGLAPLAGALLDHLGEDGRLRTGPDGRPRTGVFTARVVKDSAAVFDRVLVDGRPPTSTAQLRPLVAWLETDRLLDALIRAWPPGALPHPGHDLRDRFRRYAAELELLDRVLRLGSNLEAEEVRSREQGLPRPHWDDARQTANYAVLPDAITAAEAATAATGQLDELADVIRAGTARHDSAATAGDLLAAVRGRDTTAFSRTVTRLSRLHEVRRMLAEREAATLKLTAASARLADAVRSTPELPVWTERLAALEQAWAWAAAQAWLVGMAGGEVDVMQHEIIRIEDTIRERVTGLAATRAWSHAVAPTRLSRGARASLEQYAALVRRFGKTGGQYKVQRRAEIREAMDRCRPAVPVWIMPLYRIADQLRITPGMFDVVVVDEASQAGLEATFLQYLAPRIVVIGDDKQVSPSAVGVDQQQLRDLAQQYLYDDQYRSTWQDPQRSLFDEARMRFGGMITLTEHRRCVPEIIGFSNRIAYEPDGVRLVPVRQFGPDRLDPVVPVLVEDGYETGTTTNRVNKPEVDAIVAQIEACIVDPHYAGRTMGVISLLGPAQAKKIEKKLLERLPPEEWAARDLRCGDAAAFQGSERDVMFLSMVAAASPGRRLAALTATQYVQRYNVAASRAKDQMWVFHSVRLDDLTSAEDMRFQLLDYCYGVRSRGSSDEDGIAEPAVPEDVRVTPFDSLFEQRVCNRITDRGYTVVPQYPALGYSIDLVVVGAAARLAIECDGDHWHGPDVYQRDMARQRELERCGWVFVRILESDFVRDPAAALEPVWERLAALGIHPSGWAPPDTDAEALDPQGVHKTEPAERSVDTADPEADRRPDLAQSIDDLSGPVSPRPPAAITGSAPDGGTASRPHGTGETDSHQEPEQPTSAGDAEEHDQRVAEPVNEEQSPAMQHIDSSPTNAGQRRPDVTAPMQQPGLADLGPRPVEVLTSGDTASAAADGDGPSSTSLPPYVAFRGVVMPVDTASTAQIINGLVQIVEVEGPIVGHRLHHVYVKSSAGQRVGQQIARTLNQAVSSAVRRGLLVSDDPLGEPGVKPRTFRTPAQPTVLPRQLGPRDFTHVPPAELAAVMRAVAQHTGWESDTLFRSTASKYEIRRLGSSVRARLELVARLATSSRASETPSSPVAGDPPDRSTSGRGHLGPIFEQLLHEAQVTRGGALKPDYKKMSDWRTTNGLVFAYDRDAAAVYAPVHSSTSELTKSVRSSFYPFANLRRHVGAGGKLQYGRHSGLSLIPELRDADLIRFAPQSGAEMRRVLDALILVGPQ